MEPHLLPSLAFLTQVTNSFHLINASRAGSELLTDAVQKIVDARLDDRVVEALLPIPDGATGQNLRAHTLRERNEKDEELAEMWLFSIFARYESWADAIEAYTPLPGASRASQFYAGTSALPGYQTVFGNLQKTPTMMNVFGASVEVDRYWLGGDSGVTKALTLYRYYKEVRNSRIHSGGVANQRLVNAAAEATAACSFLKGAVGWRGQPPVKFTLQQPVSVDFNAVRDVIALMQRLVFSIDARILLSPIGERTVVERWQSVHGSKAMSIRTGKHGPAWFGNRVSAALGLPYPVRLDRPSGEFWGPDQRSAFTSFALTEGLMRREI